MGGHRGYGISGTKAVVLQYHTAIHTLLTHGLEIFYLVEVLFAPRTLPNKSGTKLRDRWTAQEQHPIAEQGGHSHEWPQVNATTGPKRGPLSVSLVQALVLSVEHIILTQYRRNTGEPTTMEQHSIRTHNIHKICVYIYCFPLAFFFRSMFCPDDYYVVSYQHKLWKKKQIFHFTPTAGNSGRFNFMSRNRANQYRRRFTIWCLISWQRSFWTSRSWYFGWKHDFYKLRDRRSTVLLLIGLMFPKPKK